MKLFFAILGATPKGRLTEQHDVFFGIANQVLDLVPEMHAFWPEAGKSLHIDSYRQVTKVGNYHVQVVEKNAVHFKNVQQLFFVNLGGYLPNDMEEYHYKILCVAKTKGEAVKLVKKTAFYQDYNQPSASHIDDHLGVDIDELFKVEDALPKSFKEKYTLRITAISKENNHQHPEDALVVGYLKFPK
jgi:hypothetical protein